MELLLIRHGRSLGDDEKRCEGGGWDAPLTAEGIWQARLLSERLKREQYRFDVLFSSTLQRARSVAEIISEAAGTPVTYDKRLEELHTGVIGGLTHEEIATQFPAPPGGHRSYVRIPQGECTTDLIGRALNFYTELLDKCADKSVCIVSHGGTIRVLISLIYGLPLTSPFAERPLFRFRAGDTSMSRFTIQDGCVITHFLNDMSHLLAT